MKNISQKQENHISPQVKLQYFLAKYANNSKKQQQRRLDTEEIMEDLITTLFPIETDDRIINRLQERFKKMKEEVRIAAKGISSRTEDEIQQMKKAICHVDAQLNERYMEEVRRGGEYGTYEMTERRQQ